MAKNIGEQAKSNKEVFLFWQLIGPLWIQSTSPSDKIDALKKCIPEIEKKATVFTKNMTPVGKNIISIFKHALMGLFSITVGMSERSWWSDAPNLDLIRRGVVHTMSAVKEFFSLSGTFFVANAALGALGFIVGSSYLATLSLAFGSILIAGGLSGAILSHDLYRLADNIQDLSKDQVVTSVAMMHSGWGVVGFTKTLFYGTNKIFGVDLNALINRSQNRSEDELKQKLTDMAKEKLSRGMTPIGQFALHAFMNHTVIKV